MAINSSIFVAETQIQVAENAGQVIERVARTGSLLGDVTITYGVTSDTATAGLDFRGGYYTVVMPSGANEVSIPIPIYDDTAPEATETFAFSIVNVDGATLWAPRTSRISILDNETPAPPPPPEPPLVSDYQVTMQTMVSGLDQPIRLVAAPFSASRMFVAEKPGVIVLADMNTGQSTTFLDISGKVNSYNDRGILGMALHPDFANNPYVYVFATIDPPDSAGLLGRAGPDGGGNRYAQLLRYTADAKTGFTTVVPGSETVLLGKTGKSLNDISGGGWLDYTDPTYANATASDRISGQTGMTPSAVVNGIRQDYIKVDSISHAGGALAFGADGALYVSTGDGTSFDFADPRSLDVQSLDSLSGKILRINPMTGLGLPTNPFVTDPTQLGSDMAKIFQYGLRNPFSISFDQEQRLIITDTGWNSWEELNSGGPGANFGWPWYEGSDGGISKPAPGYSGFAGAQAFYAGVNNGTIKLTAPYRAFSHDNADPGFQVQAITGGEVAYGGSVYPASFQNHYIFSDFAQGRSYAVNLADRTDTKFLVSWPSGYAPVDYVQGADGYVYYADIALGRIGRLMLAPASTNGGPPPDGPVNLTLGTGSHSLVVRISQDAWLGSALYTLAVDGVQIGGTLAASALRTSATDDLVTLRGDWGSGPHRLSVTFLNDGYGGTPDTDRNLYVDGVTVDGIALTAGTAALLGTGTADIAFPIAAPPASVTLGSGSQTLLLRISGDAWQGNAQYTLAVDGVQVGGTLPASALHGTGQSDTVTLLGNWAAGPHRLTVTFLNDGYGGTPDTDRNLWIESVSYNGGLLTTGAIGLLSAGPRDLAFTNGVAPPPPPTGDITLGTGFHSLVVRVSEDAWQGDAQFTLAVDGVQVGGTLTASALHGLGQSQAITLKGDWAPGAHRLTVNFLNDAYGGTAATDRNLYVDGLALDGTAQPNGTASLLSAGPFDFAFTRPADPATGTTLGSGAQTLVVKVSEDAWQGDAQYSLAVDGVALGGTLTARASHALGQSESITIKGDWAPGQHQVAVTFLNDAYGGSAATDRNLYVDGVTYQGTALPNGTAALLAPMTASFGFSVAHSLAVRISQDAWQGDVQYTLAVDGVQVGGTRTASASHASGLSEVVTLSGDWGAGQHRLTVNFLNDAYGGTPGTDRNLYVDGLAYDGTAQANTTAALLSAGAKDFLFA